MDLSRQEKILNPMDVTVPCHIIGVGATGSWLALQLFKMGIKDIRMYDFDTVEPHNVPNQLFGYNDVGTSKIEAMMKILHKQIEWDENSDNSILTSQENTFKFVTPDYQEVCGKIEKITKENFSQLIENGYVFCLVDSMSARKDLFECCKYNIKIKAFFVFFQHIIT